MAFNCTGPKEEASAAFSNQSSGFGRGKCGAEDAKRGAVVVGPLVLFQVLVIDPLALFLCGTRKNMWVHAPLTTENISKKMKWIRSTGLTWFNPNKGQRIMNQLLSLKGMPCDHVQKNVFGWFQTNVY